LCSAQIVTKTKSQKKSPGADSLYDCFHNVDGENLFEALLELCKVAKEHGRPITFE
jgi:hypothetical protein